MRAVISTVGKDRPGILAFVSKMCADHNMNIVDVTQKVLDGLFTMIMITELDESKNNFEKISTEIEQLGLTHGLKIHVMHEDIFNCMHTI